MRAGKILGETWDEAGGGASGWSEAGADTYRDHVVAHVLGTTVLGHFEAEDALHLLLDIDFVWTVFVDGQMLLRHERLALSELDVGEEERAALAADFDRLHGSRESPALARRAPPGCLVREVTLYESGARRLLRVACEQTSLLVETQAGGGAIIVRELPAAPEESRPGFTGG